MEDPAIARFREMLAKDPRSMAFAPLAEAYRKAGRLDEAVSTAEGGLKLHPGYLGGLVVLGRALFEKGQVDRSYEVLEKVVRENPDNYMAAKTVARILSLRGQALAARDAFRRVGTLMPGDPEVAAELARLEPMAAAAEAKVRAAEEEARRKAEEERAAREAEARAKEEAERAAAAAANPFATGGHIQDLLSSTVGFGGFDEEPSAGPGSSHLPSFVTEEPLVDQAPPPPADLTLSAAEALADVVEKAPPPPPPHDPVGDRRPEPLGAAGAAPPAGFATETLARLYAQQGAKEEAEAIYRTMGKAPETDGVLAAMESWLANAERMKRR